MNDISSYVKVIEDPIKFTAACWPDITLAEHQRDILISLRDNNETLVHAANEVGKDFVTAIAVLWFFCSRRPARVITSSSGETQLKSILWSEIKQRIATSQIKFPLKVDTLAIRWINEDGSIDPLSYIIGHVTKSVENFQGHHLPNDKPRVMCVFDEASGVGDEYNEAADSWAHRKLTIGNPLNCLNFFYRDCKKGDVEHDADLGLKGKLRKVIHVSAEDSPNVRLGIQLAKANIPGPYPNAIPGMLTYAEYRRRQKIWDRIKRSMRLDGKFYEGDETLLYPPEWLDLAENVFAELCPLGFNDGAIASITDTVESMGVDCGAGRDLTCWTPINRRRVINQIALPTPDTMDIVRQTVQLIEMYRLDPRKVFFDAGGGGKQIADRLREMGLPVQAVFFGESPTPPAGHKTKRTKDKVDQAETRQTYKNRRAEMYGLLRDILDPTMNDKVFGIPVELYELRKELAIMPLMYDAEGKMYLPPKDHPPTNNHSNTMTIKKILGHSPDRADSLVLAVFGLLGRPTRRKVGAL